MFHTASQLFWNFGCMCNLSMFLSNTLPKYEPLFLSTKRVCLAKATNIFWNFLMREAETNRCKKKKNNPVQYVRKWTIQPSAFFFKSGAFWWFSHWKPFLFDEMNWEWRLLWTIGLLCSHSYYEYCVSHLTGTNYKQYESRKHTY